MPAIGVASLIFSVSQIVISSPQQSYRVVSNKAIEWIRTDVRDHGLIAAIVIRFYQPEAWSMIIRVRKSVLKAHDQECEALLFKNSHVASFNMIGIAGAIVAQIAITAISLPNLEDTHWTAEAAFVVAIVSGCLAVYAACIMQISLGELHNGAAMLEWLRITKTPDRWTDRALYGSGNSISLSAALMLGAPVTLLHWSLSTLLIGLGIYYGFIFGKDLGNLQGQNANLAMLLVFVIFTLTFIGIFLAPRGWAIFETTLRTMNDHKQKHNKDEEESSITMVHKQSHSSSDRRLSSIRPVLPSTPVVQPVTSEPSQDPTLIALQQAVEANRASLTGLETLLQKYIARHPP